MDVLWDEQKTVQIFKSCCIKIKKALKITSLTDKLHADRLKIFTSSLTSLPDLELESGTVLYYNDLRGFGFIKSYAGNDVWVHISEVGNATELVHGQQVEYKIKDSPKGPQAIKVRVL